MLPEPYPSSPTRPPIAAVWFQCEGKFFEIHTFAQLYAARTWLDQIMHNHVLNWQSDTELHVIGDTQTLRIKCDQLTEILEYKRSKTERDYQPEYCWQAMINKIKRFDEEIPCPKSSTSEPEQSIQTPSIQTKPKRHKTQKQTKDGMISIAQICEEIQLAPNKGRNILRKAKIEKPKQGWTFKTNDPELTNIRKLLAKG